MKNIKTWKTWKTLETHEKSMKTMGDNMAMWKRSRAQKTWGWLCGNSRAHKNTNEATHGNNVSLGDTL